MLPFYISVGLFLVSFIGSFITEEESSYFGPVEVTTLLAGLALLFISAPLVLSTASRQSDRFRAGMFSAGTAAALLAVWPFVLVVLVFPVGNDARNACRDMVGASAGRITDITQSLFPTQIRCDTTQGANMASVYSGWESAGLSSVTLFLAGFVAVGIWLMTRHGPGTRGSAAASGCG